MAFAGKLARSFSTSSVQNQLVRAPIQLFGLDGRYALALYSAASKMKKLEAVEGEMKNLQILWEKDGKLKDFMCNPVVTRQEKKTAFEFVAKKNNYGDLTKNLFSTVADHGRYDKFDAILKSFAAVMSAHRGEVQCEVTTAKALDDASLKEVTAAIQSFLKSGQKMNIATKVDPSIIGGMVVSIGDKYVDMSIAKKIKLYTKVMEESV